MEVTQAQFSSYDSYSVWIDVRLPYFFNTSTRIWCTFGDFLVGLDRNHQSVIRIH